MQRFSGKTVLVTGGTSGIGLATAARLTEEGAAVIVTGRTADHIAHARDVLPAATVIENDAGAPDASAAALAAAVHGAGGRLDGVFLNAGFGVFAALDAVDADAVDAHVAVNLRAPILHAQALAPTIRDGGAVLLVSSATVGGPRADALVYSATKAALRQAARSLASTFAPRGIRVNVVTPGLTETGFHDRAGLSADDQAAYKDRMRGQIPLGRLGRPEDVAAVACFLLSDDAAYVTGAELRVDGGLTMA